MPVNEAEQLLTLRTGFGAYLNQIIARIPIMLQSFESLEVLHSWHLKCRVRAEFTAARIENRERKLAKS